MNRQRRNPDAPTPGCIDPFTALCLLAMLILPFVV